MNTTSAQIVRPPEAPPPLTEPTTTARVEKTTINLPSDLRERIDSFLGMRAALGPEYKWNLGQLATVAITAYLDGAEGAICDRLMAHLQSKQET